MLARWTGAHFKPLTRLISTLTVGFLVYFLLLRLAPAVYYRGFQLYAPERVLDISRYQPEPPSPPVSVHLVVASQVKDDISWTSSLSLPYDLRTIRYVSDSLTAEFHPPVMNIGREALMYFTYIYEFYDHLPDFSIFIHAEENPWHAQPTHRRSMSFALSLLDLSQVQKRGYFNLKTTGEILCKSEPINTTDTSRDHLHKIKEEPFMAEAFRDLFGPDIPVPASMAGPCCSQFALTKATIHRRPRDEYKRYMDWMVSKSAQWGDYITGRVWEHLFPYLFLGGRAIDCPDESASLCRMYHICFAPGDSALDGYREHWAEKDRLVEQLATTEAFVDHVWRDPDEVAWRRAKIAQLRRSMDLMLLEALDRGRDPLRRAQLTGGLDW